MALERSDRKRLVRASVLTAGGMAALVVLFGALEAALDMAFAIGIIGVVLLIIAGLFYLARRPALLVYSTLVFAVASVLGAALGLALVNLIFS